MSGANKIRYKAKKEHHKIDIYQTMSHLANKTQAINLSQGLPESIFDNLIKKKIVEHLDVHYQYTPTEGLLVLRKAISKYYENIFDPESEIITTTGCTEALLSACIAARQLGNKRIILFEPFYSYYPGLLNFADCMPVICTLKIVNNQFKIDFPALEKILQDGVRVMLLNVPHNPTGMILNQQEWHHLNSLCKKYDVTLILDHVYREFCYEEDISFQFLQDLAQQGRLVIANSISKMFAATGLRIGWLAGNKKWVNLAHQAHMHMGNCLPALLQEASAALFTATSVNQFKIIQLHYKNKRDALLKALSQFGLKCYVPSGGHFITANYKNQRYNHLSSLEFCKELTYSIGITPLPLNDFFANQNPSSVRFSFAVNDQNINQACNRLTAFS